MKEYFASGMASAIERSCPSTRLSGPATLSAMELGIGVFWARTRPAKSVRTSRGRMPIEYPSLAGRRVCSNLNLTAIVHDVAMRRRSLAARNAFAIENDAVYLPLKKSRKVDAGGERARWWMGLCLPVAGPREITAPLPNPRRQLFDLHQLRRRRPILL